MIHLTATKPTVIHPQGKLIFEGATKDLQCMLQKLKIARTFDNDTRTLLSADEIANALNVLLK